MNESDSQRPGAVYRHMIRGSAWAVAMQWFVRGIGLISIIILARLLTPEDFGIVTMATLVAGVVAGFSEMGAQVLLIREPIIDRSHCDTAWTIKVIQAILAGLVLIAISPLAAVYFDDDRILPVLWVLAFGVAVEGFQNIGMVLARRELDFARDFRFHVYLRIVGFCVTIGFALAFRNYWALIIGQTLMRFLGIPLSYAMHSYRPRFSLEKGRQYLVFAGSIVPHRFGKYLNEKADSFVAGGFSNAAQLGSYGIAADLSSMLTREIITPIGRGLMPNYTKLAGEPRRLAEAYRNVLATTTALVLPFGLGLSAVADSVVLVILGDQWVDGISLVRWLAVYSMLASLIHMLSGQILIARGRERLAALFVWLRLCFLIPFTVAGGYMAGVEGIAKAAVGASILILPMAAFVLTSALPIGWKGILISSWRPWFAAIVMGLCVRLLADSVVDLSPILELAVLVLFGAVVYVGCSGGLWLIAGRPEGLERGLLTLLAPTFRDGRLPWR